MSVVLKYNELLKFNKSIDKNIIFELNKFSNKGE